MKKTCGTCEFCMPSDKGCICAGYGRTSKYSYGDVIAEDDMDNYSCDDWEVSFFYIMSGDFAESEES